MNLRAITLENEHVRLEPLGFDHVAGLEQAAADGSVRDSVVYSIVAAEWPDVRRLLTLKLSRRRLPPPPRA